MVIIIVFLSLIGFDHAHGAPQPLVTICHDEQGDFITIEVKDNKVQFHLDHGDYLGECSGTGGSTGSTGSTGEESKVEINDMYFVDNDLYVEWTEPVWNEKSFDSAEVMVSSKSQCQSSIFDSQEVSESSESGEHQTVFNEILELLEEPVYVCVFVDSDDGGGSPDSEDIEYLTLPSNSSSEPLEVQQNTGSKNEWDTRPTFGKDHNHGKQLVDYGFGFNEALFEISDNNHTHFEKQVIDVGTQNLFSAKVYSSKGLKVQEFLFGIPEVGQGHLAETGVEVWYGINGEIKEIKLVQDSEVIDETSIAVTHEKDFCHHEHPQSECDQTNILLKFQEPLQHDVMAIKAIDFKNRIHTTYLNEGVKVQGESLSPPPTEMIASNIKGEGLVKVTQLEKYSPYWVTDDGRVYEKNSFDSFKLVNKEFERFQDKGDPRTRLHSGFDELVKIEQNKASELFDSKLIESELPESHTHDWSKKEKLDEEKQKEMSIQEEIARRILAKMNSIFAQNH